MRSKSLYRFLIILLLLIIPLFFPACDNGTTSSIDQSATYKYDVFTITKDEFNSVSMVTPWTFTNMRNFYSALRAKSSSSSLYSASDAKESDIYDFLISNDVSVSDTKNEINFLKSVGNDIIWGEYVSNSNFYVVMYAERI